MTAVNSFVVRFIITAFTIFFFLSAINTPLYAGRNLIEGNADNLTVRAKDVDVRDLLMALAEISGRNIIVDPRVKGRITLYLKNVTWQEVLDAVLFFNNLGYVEVSSNGIISPYDKMERIVGNLDETFTAPVGEGGTEERVVTIRCPMSFNEAKAIWPEIMPLLSPKGKFQYDKKTSCAQVVDVPDNAKMIIDLITLKKSGKNNP